MVQFPTLANTFCIFGHNLCRLSRTCEQKPQDTCFWINCSRTFWYLRFNPHVWHAKRRTSRRAESSRNRNGTEIGTNSGIHAWNLRSTFAISSDTCNHCLSYRGRLLIFFLLYNHTLKLCHLFSVPLTISLSNTSSSFTFIRGDWEVWGDYLPWRAPRHQITQHIRCGLRPCPLGHAPFGRTSYMLGTVYSFHKEFIVIWTQNQNSLIFTSIWNFISNTLLGILNTENCHSHYFRAHFCR